MVSLYTSNRNQRLKYDPFYNADKEEHLVGYDGAVDGVKIVGGVAVAALMLTGLPAPEVTISAPRSSRLHQPPQDVDIEPAIQQAIRVIGGREEAMRWLGTPVRALGFATPISRLHDAAGRDQVLSVLTNLEHGVL